MSVVSAVSVIRGNVIKAHEVLDFWRLLKIRIGRFLQRILIQFNSDTIQFNSNTILNTKKYANVNYSNYFNMSKHLTRILEV